MLKLTPSADLPVPPPNPEPDEVRLLPTYYCSFDWVAGQYIGGLSTSTTSTPTTQQLVRSPLATAGGFILLVVGLGLGATTVVLALRELQRGKLR